MQQNKAHSRQLLEKQVKEKKLILIGNANVGKSVIFGLFTGQYVAVSNYPGTTVEIARGTMKSGNQEYSVIDTPGIANLLPMSADEMVTRDILMEPGEKVILQVADAKNLSRTLLLTLQAAEMNLPLILDLNMFDEAQERRINIDYKKLSKLLDIPVVPTVAISRSGIDNLKKAINNPRLSPFQLKYDPNIEEAVEKIIEFLPPAPISKRSIALMILAEDHSIYTWLKDNLNKQAIEKIEKICRDTRDKYPDHLSYAINRQRLEAANALVDKVATFKKTPREGLSYNLGKICMHNVWGIPILLCVLGLMYLFVGQFAAGTLVDWMESVLFGKYIIPWITGLIEYLLPFPIVIEALVGEYGILSVGLTYALAIVLPIVAAFFIFFGLLEDSGYLPRLAIIANRAFNSIGLNGKAVLPMILGLGCGTMAALSARILDTKKEQIMVILLLSLGVPCSAQLGVIMGMLGGMDSPAILIWLLIIGSSIILVGYIANRVLPGKNSDFILEIPPLRIPSFKNIFIKTVARLEWYLKEAVPLFIIATFVLFLVDKVGILQAIYNVASPVIVKLLGLPVDTTQAFIIGFLRRDYGAAGLFDMQRKGLLTNNQVLVAMVTITLFLPCVAQFLVIIKEKGIKQALAVSGFVLAFSFSVGGLLNYFLNVMGIQL